MNPLQLLAPAKVNLHLRVLARESSGYHQLETLFAMLELADAVAVELTPGESSVTLQEEGASPCPPQENLAFRAALAFRRHTGISEGVRIRLRKVLPTGGGLGGGSSDAAAVLRLMNRVFNDPLPRWELAELGGELGSDVPFFLSPSSLALAWGRGNRILPLRSLPPAPVLLALPPLAVSTPKAFQALTLQREGVNPTGATLLERSFPGGWDGVARRAVNDLEPPVLQGNPELAPILEALRRTQPRLALLAGSGSSLFGIYRSDTQAGEVAQSMEERFPEVRWVLTRTLDRPPEIQEAPPV
ncbi:MAG: 4-(cytidine 5'-diphospho)-2-C-methyl-D-erythritol kinase [Gemmatimonadota bacterium]